MRCLLGYASSTGCAEAFNFNRCTFDDKPLIPTGLSNGLEHFGCGNFSDTPTVPTNEELCGVEAHAVMIVIMCAFGCLLVMQQVGARYKG